MKNLLSKHGCTVVTMDSAEEAEQTIQWGEHFNLIITDLKMPWLNGLQFCKRIKARHPDVLIYALSGNIEAFDEDDLKNSGFDGIFQKPISRETVKQILVNRP
jgi:CheY-like chemotaxis protein